MECIGNELPTLALNFVKMWMLKASFAVADVEHGIQTSRRRQTLVQATSLRPVIVYLVLCILCSNLLLMLPKDKRKIQRKTILYWLDQHLWQIGLVGWHLLNKEAG